MKSITYTEACTGCRACELACSYHHRKLFSRKVSSIEVQRLEKERKFVIVLYQQPEGRHFACDNCGFCLRYCPEVARDELEAILKGREGQE